MGKDGPDMGQLRHKTNILSMCLVSHVTTIVNQANVNYSKLWVTMCHPNSR
jgi:hypothetical protein